MPKRQSTQSAEWFRRANRFIPGGVNSPVRAFRAVDGIPPFIARGRGCRLFDEDGNEYIDFVGSWGPLILGHAHPEATARLVTIAEQAPTDTPRLARVAVHEQIKKHACRSQDGRAATSVEIIFAHSKPSQIGAHAPEVEELDVESGTHLSVQLKTVAIPSAEHLSKRPDPSEDFPGIGLTHVRGHTDLCLVDASSEKAQVVDAKVATRVAIE